MICMQWHIELLHIMYDSYGVVSFTGNICYATEEIHFYEKL